MEQGAVLQQTVLGGLHSHSQKKISLYLNIALYTKIRLKADHRFK